jgi:sigma 54 modulation/S30EA-like ribosomal protein
VRIQINSDKNIAVDTRIANLIEGEAKRALKRFAGKLTRVEFHLSDVNAKKFGTHDKRCLVEVRPAGHRPLAVSNAAATVEAAVGGVLIKLRSALQTLFGRTAERRRQDAPAPIRKARTLVEPKRPRGNKKAAAAGAAAATTAAQTGDLENAGVSERGPKKKRIYRARREAWPRRP